MAAADSFEISPREVTHLQKSGKLISIIDVREPNEWAVSHLEGASLVPMNTVPANLQFLEGQADSSDLIVYCHHGVRSLQVVAWLREKGIENCLSMTGGIDRWSLEIDPNVPRY
ncbi:MAG TPA: rhodanese-like domain-containing protein [Bryobacteraceae bacterium]|nr:rhodanese-like domain-containing protein [Bryobacteraceae bacterium]